MEPLCKHRMAPLKSGSSFVSMNVTSTSLVPILFLMAMIHILYVVCSYHSHWWYLKQELQDPVHNTHLRQANYSDQKPAGMKALLFPLFINKYLTTQVSCLNLPTLKQKHLPSCLWWIHLVDGSHRLVCMYFHEGSVSHKLAVTKPIVIVKSFQSLAVWSKRDDWHYEILPAMLLICREALPRQHAPQAVSVAHAQKKCPHNQSIKVCCWSSLTPAIPCEGDNTLSLLQATAFALCLVL